ncbi:hypothetical protein KP509_20G075000 [Ceratopteris richardii]|uniref:Uncharacterized protein n=1 Tax=Ceratopteris richardii TaxID=49495 RepID=A0A8T2SH46_CERRI|nr:hypothetical protein KP509_20G075000 [Ceratopteris richardii]
MTGSRPKVGRTPKKGGGVGLPSPACLSPIIAKLERICCGRSHKDIGHLSLLKKFYRVMSDAREDHLKRGSVFMGVIALVYHIESVHQGEVCAQEIVSRADV